MDEAKNRTLRTDERRRLIIEVAAALFLEKGFHQTSIRDIAERAGISLGNLYNHFSGKPELIAAIATLEAEENDALIGLLTQGEGEAPVMAFAKECFSLYCRPENGVLAAEILSESFRNPAVREGFVANRQRLASALRDAIAKASPSAAAGPERADMIIDLVEGAAIRQLLGGPGTIDETALMAAIRRLAFD
ncbi:TetR family transcriptional regulator [Gellertiella hungarica]|uniref:AcrR family transcriptional regulator n=1 Tax=Gellertiella hungarica TaxID=1572859 RepID=A0A7W6NJL0_9HYPH|nr:AcrR family transcriptional regulator [Gellertiella hungarica]